MDVVQTLFRWKYDSVCSISIEGAISYINNEALFLKRKIKSQGHENIFIDLEQYTPSEGVKRNDSIMYYREHRAGRGLLNCWKMFYCHMIISFIQRL